MRAEILTELTAPEGGGSVGGGTGGGQRRKQYGRAVSILNGLLLNGPHRGHIDARVTGLSRQIDERLAGGGGVPEWSPHQRPGRRGGGPRVDPPPEAGPGTWCRLGTRERGVGGIRAGGERGGGGGSGRGATSCWARASPGQRSLIGPQRGAHGGPWFLPGGPTRRLL